MAEDSPGIKRSLLRRLVPLAMLAVFCAALWALHREISHFSFADLRAYLAELSGWRLALAIGTTVAGYVVLMSYDWFALRYVGQKLAGWQIALTAFVGYAFSMNIGQTVLSGGAVRMRLYTGWGLGAGDVTRIIGFNFVIGLVGQMLMAGLLFVSVGVRIPDSVPVPPDSVSWLGVALLGAVTAFLLLVNLKRKAIRIRSWRFELPRPGLAQPAILMSALDWALSGVVLFALMPADLGVDLSSFLGIVMLAHIVAVLSGVPGGLGVFETVVIHLLPETMPKAEALSALIAYRALYYLAPFLLAIVLFGGYEAAAKKKALSAASARIGDWLAPLLPIILSVTTFAAGALLLLSGATPAIGSRLVRLERWLPIEIIELSHFLGSIVGVALLILSMALRRRIDAAWYGTVLLLGVGIVMSLLKGLDYEEAIVLTLILLMVLPCRRRFHRRASLFSLRFTPAWWTSVGLLVGMVTWIGFSASERVHYHPGIWLHVGFKGDAARFLRASAGIGHRHHRLRPVAASPARPADSSAHLERGRPRPRPAPRPGFSGHGCLARPARRQAVPLQPIRSRLPHVWNPGAVLGRDGRSDWRNRDHLQKKAVALPPPCYTGGIGPRPWQDQGMESYQVSLTDSVVI